MLCLTFNTHFHSIYITLMMNHTYFAFAYLPSLKISGITSFHGSRGWLLSLPSSPLALALQCSVLKIDLVREKE